MGRFPLFAVCVLLAIVPMRGAAQIDDFDAALKQAAGYTLGQPRTALNTVANHVMRVLKDEAARRAVADGADSGWYK